MGVNIIIDVRVFHLCDAMEPNGIQCPSFLYALISASYCTFVLEERETEREREREREIFMLDAWWLIPLGSDNDCKLHMIDIVIRPEMNLQSGGR